MSTHVKHLEAQPVLAVLQATLTTHLPTEHQGVECDGYLHEAGRKTPLTRAPAVRRIVAPVAL